MNLSHETVASNPSPSGMTLALHDFITSKTASLSFSLSNSHGNSLTVCPLTTETPLLKVQDHTAVL